MQTKLNQNGFIKKKNINIKKLKKENINIPILNIFGKSFCQSSVFKEENSKCN